MVDIPGVPKSTVRVLQRKDEEARGISSAYGGGDRGFSSAGKRSSGGTRIGGGRRNTAPGSLGPTQQDLDVADQLRIAAEADSQKRAAAQFEANRKAAELEAQKSNQLASEMRPSLVSELKRMGVATSPPTFIGSGANVETLADLQGYSRSQATQDIYQGFAKLTPEQAYEKTLAGERGFRGTSTKEGTLISFDLNEFQPEIDSASSVRAVGKKYGFSRTAKAVGGSALTAVAKETLSLPEFITEDIVLNVFSRQGTTKEIKEGPQVALFDKGIFARAKSIKSDPVQIGSQIAIGTALVGSQLLKSAKIVKAEGVTAATKGLASDFSPVKPKPGIYTPDLRVEPIRMQVEELNIGTGSVQIGSGRGRLSPDVRVKSFGVSGKAKNGDVTNVQVTGISSPFLEITKTGDIKSGRLEFISPTVSVQGKKTFKSKGLLLDNVVADFPETRINKIVTGDKIYNSFSGRRTVSKVENKLFTREDFFFGSGSSLVQTDKLGLGSGKVKGLVSDPFFAQVTGRGRSTSFLNSELSKELTGTKIVGRRGQRTISKQKAVQKLKVSNSFASGIEASLKSAQKAFSSNNLQKGPAEILTGPDAFGQRGRSEFYGRGTYEKTSDIQLKPLEIGRQRSVVSEKNLLEFKPLAGSALPSFGNIRSTLLTGQPSRQLSPSFSIISNVNAQPSALSPVQIPGQISSNASRNRSDQISALNFQGDNFRPIVFPEFGFGGGRGFTPGRAIGGLGFFDSPGGTGRTKRKLKRQVSLVALELGIKRRNPINLEQTGLFVRGI